MKTLNWKILLYDRPILVLSAAIILTVIFTLMSTINAGRYEGKIRELKSQLSEIRTLSGEVIEVKSSVASRENKLKRKQSSGVVSILEQVLKTLGLEAQVIKPLGKTKAGEFKEENAELELKDADLNSIVNLLYKLESSPMPLKIKTAAIQSSFEDPDKFVVKLTVSLMSK